MAIIDRASFALVLTALLSSSVSGQTHINFQTCKLTEDTRAADNTATTFGTGDEGSERRTYGLLCAGSAVTGTDVAIAARIGHPFKTFCDLIDLYPNVKNLMSTGSSSHTVFAPTDSAFSKVDGLIDRVDEQKLLELHILPEARLTRDLRCGQTYRTINTGQDRRNNQRSKTRCISAARSQQLGPGNVVNGLKPTIGAPGNIFRADEFGGQENFVLFENSGETLEPDRSLFSQDAIACNGVVHVVDEVLLPSNGRNAFSNQGPGNGDYYYGGAQGAQNNYYSGASHTHDYYGGHRNYYARSKGKGAKGGRRGGPRRAPIQDYYYSDNYYVGGNRGGNGGGNRGGYYGFRKLEGDNTADADEMSMSDAEFFGTNALVENDATKNRKRRLEALLEPDGNIAQA